MRISRTFLLFFGCAAAMMAKPQEFTILGSEKIMAETERGMPLPAEKDGIKISVAAFMVGDGKLIFTFGLTSANELTSVVVEDVTESKASVLVEDNAPTLKNGYWKGNAIPLPLSKSGVPWVFTRGDTTKVFRVTAVPKSESRKLVLYQPAVYSGGTKQKLQQMAQ
jgi:hypothetical protein